MPALQQQPDPSAASSPEIASTGTWQRVFCQAGCVALIAIGAVFGFIGLLKIQAVEYPLNIEMRAGCLADPSLRSPGAPCPHEAEAILHYPDGRSELVRGAPQQVERRVTQATQKVIAAERWRGVGYLLVTTLLVGSGIAAIAWRWARRRRWRSRRLDPIW
jgi:hypothetical protein